MAVSPEVLAAARASLTGPRHAVVGAAEHVPDAAGLYAIYGDAQAWRELALGDPRDDRPLYIGKAEASLVSRDLRTHFIDGRTGSSTVRRSFAALLRSTLDLRALPRNPDKPERCANFGLAPGGDEKLTNWMQMRLRLAVWRKPSESADLILKCAEMTLAREWLPPINLDGVATPWTGQVLDARKVMTAEARAWAREHGFKC